MNEKFYQLTQEKQNKMINSGFEVFGKFGYQKASTELIAAKAGISKGLLFHYFHNKLEYFRYLYTYAENIMRENIERSGYADTHDFFESLEMITQRKCSLLKDNPYILDFLVTATCSQDERVQEVINDIKRTNAGEIIETRLNNIDFTKFKEDVRPEDMIEMLSFSLEGLLKHKLRNNETLDIDQIMEKYKIWLDLLKKSSYQ